MPKLYELSSAYQSIAALIEQDDGNDWIQALASLTGDIEDKAENIAKLLQSIKSDREAYEAEANRLAKRADTLSIREAYLREYLKHNLEACGLDRLKAGLFTVSLQASPPACLVVDADAVPEQYRTLVPASWVIERRRIIEAWKAGEAVPGTTVTVGKHLRVR